MHGALIHEHLCALIFLGSKEILHRKANISGKQCFVGMQAYMHCKNKVFQMMHMKKHMIATEKKHFYVSQRFRNAHRENTAVCFW